MTQVPADKFGRSPPATPRLMSPWHCFVIACVSEAARFWPSPLQITCAQIRPARRASNGSPTTITKVWAIPSSIGFADNQEVFARQKRLVPSPSSSGRRCPKFLIIWKFLQGLVVSSWLDQGQDQFQHYILCS